MTSAVLGPALLIAGAKAFRSTAASVGPLIVSVGIGAVMTIPMWRMLIGRHRFHCFYCEGETARVRRHDDNIQHDWWRNVRYTFECERCGRVDSQL